MARVTTIKRVVDALQLQQRIILNLECMHNIPIKVRDLVLREKSPDAFKVGDEYLCPHCPAEAPPPEDPAAATAHQEFDALFPTLSEEKL